ncbi:MAG: peptidoglycan DD-metalloendopeptidase family protein [Ruminococcus sp.]|nr:peptidoglycan DD-metalloendopeptidase family protein [Ruminococcus sp.]
MKKLLSMLTCSVLTVTMISAYSRSESENNKIEAKTIAEIQEERKQNEAEIDALQKEIDSLEGKKEDEQEYQETLSQQIEVIQENIYLLETEINQLGTEIAAAEENIVQLNEDIANQQIEVDSNIELFKERLCAMYVTGNDSLASAVLGSADFYDMLSRMEMINNIAAHDEELVNELLDQITNLENSKKAYETEKLTLEVNKETQEAKKAEMDEDIEELNETIKKSEAEIERLALEQKKKEKSQAALEQENATLQAQEDEIREQIRKAAEEEARRKEEEKKRLEEEAKKQQEAAANQNNSGSSSSSSGSSSSDTVVDTTPSVGGFAWPAPGYYYISSGYGSRWGTTHRGIDIAGGGISGAAATASKSGTVIGVRNSCSHNYAKYSNCCGNGYGNYVIVSHGDGYTTLYGHLSSVSVSVGDYVSQGQKVGTIGCTGYSTGFHLHFEIRKNGSAVNPSNYV